LCPPILMLTSDFSKGALFFGGAAVTRGRAHGIGIGASAQVQYAIHRGSFDISKIPNRVRKCLKIN
jgi:hypothetical protein